MQNIESFKNVETTEKVDNFQNDEAYKKLLSMKEVKVDIDWKNKVLSKQELPEFYKNLKSEAVDTIKAIVNNSNSNVLKFFDNDSDKFANEVFNKYFSHHLDVSTWINRNFVGKEIWNNSLVSLLKLNFKNKEDFFEAFQNVYIKEKTMDFLKWLFSNDKNISWQNVQKVNNILSSFELWDKYSDYTFWKITDDSLELLNKVNALDLSIADLSSFWYDDKSRLKKLNLINSEWKLNVNTAIQVVAFLQWKIDKIVDINGNELSEDQKQQLTLYALESIWLDNKKYDKFVKEHNLKSDLIFLVHTIWLNNTADLFDNLIDNKWKDINKIVWKYAINVWELQKERFLKIVNKINKEQKYTEKEFESSKQEQIKQFLALFLDANPSETINKLTDDLVHQLQIKDQSKYENLKKLISFVFSKEEISKIQQWLLDGTINDPIKAIYEKLKNSNDKLSAILNSKGKQIKKILYAYFLDYSKKILTKNKLDIFSSDSSFWKIEKDLEKNGLNSYQASVVAYYTSEYVTNWKWKEKYKWQITSALFKDKDFQEFLKNKLRAKKHKQDGDINSTVDEMVGKDSISKLIKQLSNIKLPESISFGKGTIESLKQNNLLAEKIQQYEEMWYSGYVHYVEQIENEKNLLKETGASVEKVPVNNSLLFKNNPEWNSEKIEIKSKEVDWLHIVEARIPGTNEVIEVKSLTKEQANKALLWDLTQAQFWIKLFFDNWTADDLWKIFETDITKEVLTSDDLNSLKEFYQTYAVYLIKNNIVKKDFFSENWLELKDIYENFDRFAKAFSSWLKDHLSVGWIKSLANEFYIDPFDSSVKEILDNKYRWKEIKEEILDNNWNSWVFGKIRWFMQKLFS